MLKVIIVILVLTAVGLIKFSNLGALGLLVGYVIGLTVGILMAYDGLKNG